MTIPGTPASLQEAITEYLNGCVRRYSAQTTAAYTQALNLFQQVLRKRLHLVARHIPVTALQASWVYACLTYLQEERSVETEHLYSRALIDFVGYAEQAGWSTIDAAEIARFVATHRRPKDHTIPQPPIELINRVLAYVASVPAPTGPHINQRELLGMLRDKAFVLTLAETGLKVSEITAIRRQNFNAEQRCIALPDDGPCLHLSGTTAQAITAYLRERAPLDSAQTLRLPGALPLFARHDKRAGTKVLPFSRWTASNIISAWVDLALSSQEHTALDASGQRITPQTFRHYFVITTLSQTGDLSGTRALARHSDLSTTRRYLRALVGPQPPPDQPGESTTNPTGNQ